jgi:hypothetical protein
MQPLSLEMKSRTYLAGTGVLLSEILLARACNGSTSKSFPAYAGRLAVGSFTYSLITVENAARIAAEYTSQNSTQASDQGTACTMVRAELSSLPGVSGVANCSNSTLTVTAAAVTGPDSKPATSVSVTYRGLNMIPIPGLLMGRLTFTRNVQMRVQP